MCIKAFFQAQDIVVHSCVGPYSSWGMAASKVADRFRSLALRPGHQERKSRQDLYRFRVAESASPGCLSKGLQWIFIPAQLVGCGSK